MSSHYKEIPTLTALLRRRNMTVTQWCQENRVATVDMAECLCVDNGLTLDPVAEELVSKAIVREELKRAVDDIHDQAEKTDPLPNNLQDLLDVKITPWTGKTGELTYDITVPEGSKGSRKKGRRTGSDSVDEGTRDSLEVTDEDTKKKD